MFRKLFGYARASTSASSANDGVGRGATTPIDAIDKIKTVRDDARRERLGMRESRMNYDGCARWNLEGIDACRVTREA